MQRQKLEQETAATLKAAEIVRDVKQAWVSVDRLAQTSPEMYGKSKALLQKLMSHWNIQLTKPMLVDEMGAQAKESYDDSKLK